MKILNKELNQRFVKDVRVPIGVFVEPYFSHKLALFETLYANLREKYNEFVTAVQSYDHTGSDNGQPYMEHYNYVKDSIINTVLESEGYNRLQSENMNNYAVPQEFRNLSSKSIFKSDNTERQFLSIDLRKANFQAMRNYDPAIFNGHRTWEDFVRQFTDCEHIINSKYIREATMGKCNPKRHIALEQHMMCDILTILIDVAKEKISSIDILSHVSSFNHDEIIFDVTDMPWMKDEMLRNITFDTIGSALKDFEVHIEWFTLYYIKEIDGYVEVGVNEDKQNFITTKSVNNFMMPFLIRALKNEPTEENDLVFVHPNHNMLAKFIDTPDIVLPDIDWSQYI
jgi:hypothetical protein